MERLRLEPTDSPGAFRVEGEMDISNVEEVRSRLEDELRRGHQLSLDTEGLSFMDSQGLRLLIDLGQQAAERGTAVRVLNCSSQVQRLLDIAVPDGIPGIDLIPRG